jgi:hypothetical protein
VEGKALPCRPSKEATEGEASSEVERAKIFVGNKNEAKQWGMASPPALAYKRSAKEVTKHVNT